MNNKYALCFQAAWLLAATSLMAVGITAPSRGTFICVPASCDAARAVPMPYAETFEGVVSGAPIGVISNWVAALSDATCVVGADYTYEWAPPVAASHTRIARLGTEGEVLLCAVTGTAAHVWMDLLVRFTPSEEEGEGETPFGVGLFVNSASNLSAYGRTSGGSVCVPIASGLTISPFRWYRLTVHLAYLDVPNDAFFSVSVDRALLSWPGGEALPGAPSASGLGPWLRFAERPAVKRFPGLLFQGTGAIDDLVIDNRYRGPGTAAVAGLEQAVTVTWPSDYGRRYRVDACSNLASCTWQTLAAELVGNGTTNTFFEPMRDIPSRFYRVVPLDP